MHSTSLHPRRSIVPTPIRTIGHFFSNHNSNYIHNFRTQTQKNCNTCFGAYLYSTGTQHGNLQKLSVMMSRMTYFILQAHTGTGVSHSQHRKNSGDVLEKMQVNGPEGEKLARKKSLAVGVACMAMHRPAPGFKRRTFEFWVLNRQGL